MAGKRTLYLIDPDHRRRASLSMVLSGSGWHTEPFESIAELVACRPNDGTILIYDGAGALAQLTAALPALGRLLPVIAYSDEPVTDRVVEAIFEGALDYKILPFDRAALEASIVRIETSRAQVVRERQRRFAARRSLDILTPRERQVLAGLGEGLTSREIGARLQISDRTVEIHRGNLVKKFGARSADLVRLADNAGLAAA